MAAKRAVRMRGRVAAPRDDKLRHVTRAKRLQLVGRTDARRLTEERDIHAVRAGNPIT